VSLKEQDKLRAELGITVEAPRKGKYQSEAALCTAAEIRALRQALRLTYEQFGAHFGLTTATVTHWMRMNRVLDLRVSPERHKRLKPVIDRARELGLLKLTTYRGPAATHRVDYRCTCCGCDLTKREVRKIREYGELVLVHHLLPGGRGAHCGPVQFAPATPEGQAVADRFVEHLTTQRRTV